MPTVRELEDQNRSTSDIKVRIPDANKSIAMTAGLKTMEVYVISQWMSGIWVKADMRSDRMYPLPGIRIEEILDWEVVEE